MTYSYLAISIISNVIGQILMKVAADNLKLDKLSLANLYYMATNLQLISGCFFYVIGMIAWILTLSKMDLSVAFPIYLGITYIFIVLGGWIIFNESFEFIKVIGINFILLGIILIAILSKSN